MSDKHSVYFAPPRNDFDGDANETILGKTMLAVSWACNDQIAPHLLHIPIPTPDGEDRVVSFDKETMKGRLIKMTFEVVNADDVVASIDAQNSSFVCVTCNDAAVEKYLTEVEGPAHVNLS